MNQDAKRRSTVGEMVNLMSVDCQRVQDVIAFIFILWSAPLTVALALYQLWGILGKEIFMVYFDMCVRASQNLF